MEYIQRYASPLGGITLASNGEALTGLWFDGQRYFAAGLSPEYEEKHLPVFGQTEKWLEIYFSGRDPGFTPKLSINASPFRRAVWEMLLTIPYRTTVTYGEIAARLAWPCGFRASARAVGGAVGRNPISLIIPCHRVIGAGGRLTGYAAGIERKQALLAFEGVALPRPPC